MTQPLASFSLVIRTRPHQRGRKKLLVAIWKYKKDLRAAAYSASEESKRFWNQAVGARSGRVFGEIHLWQGLIGAGYFAHELQHFMHDYETATENHPLDSEANERMAWLAGELTRQFWTKFYDKFGLKQ